MTTLDKDKDKDKYDPEYIWDQPLEYFRLDKDAAGIIERLTAHRRMVDFAWADPNRVDMPAKHFLAIYEDGIKPFRPSPGSVSVYQESNFNE